ncbi:MAG: helix-turn-helix transcriptional regulator [Prevotella sp.]|nr:helix-turn-helix transcriptional regulator [Prevotella sp.]
MNSYEELEQQIARLRATPIGIDFINRLDEAIGDISDVRDFSVERVAQAMCVTSSTLRRHLRRRVGVTPSRYFMQLRLRHAVELFSRNEQLSISVVADRCGFYDNSHLTRSFLRFMGVTPKSYILSLERGRPLV